VINAPCFRIGVWLSGYVRATYDLYSDDISGRGSSGANCRKASATDDGAKHISGDHLTLIVWKDDRSIDIWAEGGEEESSRGRGNLAHGDGRG
jgi:hypothetical protein